MSARKRKKPLKLIVRTSAILFILMNMAAYFHARPFTGYAKSITTPTLLLWGEIGDQMNRSETEAIFKNLNEEKELINYLKQGHESYLNDHRVEWISDVKGFLRKDFPSS